MPSIYDYLNNREIASAFWILLGLIFVVRKSPEAIWSFSRALFQRLIIGSLIALALYVYIIVFLLSQQGLWDAGLLKDTILWFVVTASVLLFESVGANKENLKFFKNIAIESLALSLVFEFFVNLFVMPLWAELIYIPVTFCIAMIMLVAQSQPESKPVMAPAKFCLNALALLSVCYSLVGFIRSYGSLDPMLLGKAMLVGPTLTLLLLPFIYIYALFVEYADLFTQYPTWLNGDRKLIQRAKWHTVLACKMSFAAISRLRRGFYADIYANGPPEDVGKAIRAIVSPASLDSDAILTADVLNARISDFVLPNGKKAKVVLIDWVNTGNRAIAAIWVNITLQNHSGVEVPGGATHKCVFSIESNGMQKIQPGDTYIEPEQEGFIVFPEYCHDAVKVKVELTRIDVE